MDAIEKAKEIAARLGLTAASSSEVLGKRKSRWGVDPNEAAQMEAPMKRKQKLYIPVDEYPEINFMGLLIGPRGSNQKKMEEESGAKILIRGKGSSKESTGEPDENEDLHVLITADTDDQIARAEKLIGEILYNPDQALALKREQLRRVAELNGTLRDGEGDHYGPNGGSQFGSGPGQLNVEIGVPRNMVGYIIGKGGETIRELQLKSGAHIQVVREDTVNASGERLVAISGSEETVATAKRYIANLIEEKQSGGHGGSSGGYGPSSNSLLIQVPNDKVGLIIGKGGTTIKSIQSRTTANIQIPAVPDANDPTVRTVEISGSAEASASAREEILSLLNGNTTVGATGGTVVYMQVPNDKVGLIIGKGGETIKGIQNRTGARVQIPQGPDPGTMPPIRTIAITGIAGAPDAAKYEMECVLADLSSGSSYSQYGQDTSSYGYYNTAAYGYDQQYQQTYGQYQQSYDQYYGQQVDPAADPQQQPVAVTGDTTQPATDDANDPNSYWYGYQNYAAYYGVEAANIAWGVTPAAATATGVVADPSTEVQQPPGT